VSPEEKAALQSANAKLNEGIKSLATRQNHIKIADHSDHGWGTVAQVLRTKKKSSEQKAKLRKMTRKRLREPTENVQELEKKRYA